MRTTVKADGLGKGARYGLGLVSTPLSCGGLAWGHGGDIFGAPVTAPMAATGAFRYARDKSR